MKKRIILAERHRCGNQIYVKFQLENPAGLNRFTAHGAGYVAVNDKRYECSLIVTPSRVIEDWGTVRFAGLATEHFEFLLMLAPAIVLLGTGSTLRFPHPTLSRCLAQAGVGLEVMDSAAACRTYNILSGEGRNVVAAVLLG